MRMGDVCPSLILVVTEMSHLAKEHISFLELNAFFGRTRPQAHITSERAPSHRAVATPSALARETNGAQ